MHPPAQRLARDRELRPSSFVRRCVELAGLKPNSEVLDLPCGTGRHSLHLGALGHHVTAADIDEGLLRATKERLLAEGGSYRCVMADASQPLAFDDASFDLVVIVDFVDANLLASIGRVIRAGGHLIHESYAARAGNWSQLLPPCRTEELLAPMFDVIRVEKRGNARTFTESEAIKVLARRK